MKPVPRAAQIESRRAPVEVGATLAAMVPAWTKVVWHGKKKKGKEPVSSVPKVAVTKVPASRKGDPGQKPKIKLPWLQCSAAVVLTLQPEAVAKLS